MAIEIIKIHKKQRLNDFSAANFLLGRHVTIAKRGAAAN
jgi:hypothetical protein